MDVEKLAARLLLIEGFLKNGYPETQEYTKGEARYYLAVYDDALQNGAEMTDAGRESAEFIRAALAE